MPSGLLPEIIALGVELIEQPFPARAYRDLGWLQERSSIPIVADESAVMIEDLDALVGVVAGVNVKLAKCGGIAPAKAMLERARELGFRTFLGCMEETSVGIAGSAAVASLADWVDLDGCLLLADDPFEGLDLDDDHRWILTVDRVSGSLGGPETVHARTVQAFTERPFVWITWWTKSWTSPLPADRPWSYDGRPPAAEGPIAGAAGSPRTMSGGGWIPVRPARASCCPCCRRESLPDGRGGRPSMDPRNAATGITDPDAIEFVRFCYHRRRVGWPELYDEMCAVADRGLFRGYDTDDLAGLGIGFSLFDMPALAVLSTRIIAEEQALRRPVAVMIKVDPAPRRSRPSSPRSPRRSTTTRPTEPVPQRVPDERTFDVPVRLAMVPTGA